MDMKRCPRCETEKPTDDFGPNPARKDGLQTYCKECTRAYARGREAAVGGREAVRAAVAEKFAQRDALLARGLKHCPECNAEKPVAEFSADKSKRDGLVRLCKACDYARLSKRREDNPGIRKEEMRRYYAGHKDQVAASVKRHREAHPGYDAERARAWRAANPGEAARKQAEWRAANPERAKEIGRRSALKNAEKRREQASTYAKANPAKRSAWQSARKARQIKATPAWANLFFIEEAYELAQLRTRMLGIDYHVDHIVPMRNPLVCGLHVENNLEVIPGRLNEAKGNRHWPDMPT